MLARLDHLVITVTDLEKTKSFYCDVLDMRFEAFGEGRQALHFGSQKINVQIAGKELEPRAHVAKPGTADLCFICYVPLNTVKARLEKAGIEILEGPVRRTGATGPITSLYVRDPDLNLIELSVYDDVQHH
ncbi:VOC family protein [Sneathiella glossodoripedis]|uniref:VOC family protein n=1 Tax=Sneathiella glossodoripedis TaxID=418853 RepID=UPI0004725BBD|nr:VOC family protein [Sneathiella glossodoripedis]